MTNLIIGISLLFLAIVAFYLTIGLLNGLPREDENEPGRLKTRLSKFRKRLLR
jgi:hypothetical protein